MARREVKLRLGVERLGNAVGRGVGVSDLLEGSRHLGDAVAQRDSSRPAGRMQEVGGGVVGDDLRFDADRVAQ